MGISCPAASTKHVAPATCRGHLFDEDNHGWLPRRTINSLSPTDTAYIAGLIDGEGTVTLCRKHRNENHQLAISISNTEIELLHYVLDAIGAGKITRKRTTKRHHTPSYTYALYNRQALALLEQVSPFLRTYKHKRAELILSKYQALTPKKREIHVHNAGHA
jgi:hypothetical protein